MQFFYSLIRLYDYSRRRYQYATIFLLGTLTKKWPLDKISAEVHCRSLGYKWKVTRVFDGSLICSTIEWKSNCHNCDEWRLYVWTDGATDNVNTKNCQRNKTFSGNYYCGHDPCSICGEHSFGGRWHNSR